jgi:hypothetical protein
MKLTIDNQSVPNEIEKPDWSTIENAISQLDSSTISFCILESNNGDYIQCAGKVDRMTIEIRKYTGDSFKHYRIGNTKGKRFLKTIWTTIDCKVGLIRVHDYEVLQLNDAFSLFLDFYKNQEFEKSYNMRNITKDFN